MLGPQGVRVLGPGGITTSLARTVVEEPATDLSDDESAFEHEMMLVGDDD
jgi:hypothetical protein